MVDIIWMQLLAMAVTAAILIRLIARSCIDRDPDAIKRGAAMKAEYASRFHLAEGCFSDMVGLVVRNYLSFKA